MRSSWTLSAVALLSCGLLLTVAAERRDKNDDEDRDGDDDGAHEFEDKVLRAWIEQLIDRYSKNVQSATNPTNIQRIAKKSRTSSSGAAPPAVNRENVAPLPINSIIFNPYYHPTFYSGYVPFPFGPTTTHLIPISHVPYPQQDYHHRLLIPVHAQLPYGYTHVPSVMSPTMITDNDYPNVERPANAQVQHVPTDDQGEVQDPDRTEGADGFGQHTQPPTAHRPGEHAQTDQDKYGENGQPARGGKLVSNVINIPPNPTPSAPHQTDGLHKVESAGADTSIASTTPASLTVSDVPASPSETLSGSDSQPPSDIEYRSSDEPSNTVKPLHSQSIHNEPYLTSTTEYPDTTAETETMSTDAHNPEQEPSMVEGDGRPGEPRESADATTDILETSIATEGSTSKINETPQTPEATTATWSTYLYSTTTPSAPTPLQCTNNDCSATKSAYVTAPSIETAKRQDSYQGSVQARSVNDSTRQPAGINDEQSNAIASSTRPAPTSSSISETTRYPHTTSILPNNKPLSFRVSEELTTLRPAFVQPSDKNSENAPTSVQEPTSTSPLKPLNGHIITTAESIEAKAGPTPTVTNHGHGNARNVDQDMSVSAHDESTKHTSVELSVMDKHRQRPSTTIAENISPSGLNVMSTKSLVSRVQATTEKLDVYTNAEADHYPSAIAKETSSSLKPTAVPAKASNFVQRKPSVTAASNESTYRTSANNQDRYVSEASLTPQTTKGSDVWYSHLHTQTAPKKELDDEQLDFLLKKLIKLLKPKIEKQSLTKDSITRYVTPRHADQEKLVYIILPWIRDTNKNVGNEERAESTTGPLKTSNKI